MLSNVFTFCHYIYSALQLKIYLIGSNAYECSGSILNGTVASVDDGKLIYLVKQRKDQPCKLNFVKVYLSQFLLLNDKF